MSDQDGFATPMASRSPSNNDSAEESPMIDPNLSQRIDAAADRNNVTVRNPRVSMGANSTIALSPVNESPDDAARQASAAAHPTASRPALPPNPSLPQGGRSNSLASSSSSVLPATNFANVYKTGPRRPFVGDSNALRDHRVLDSFIHEMDNWFRLSGMAETDTQSVDWVLTKLEGNALIWLHTLIKRGDKGVTHWQGIRTKLRERYQSHVQDDTLIDELTSMRYIPGQMMRLVDEYLQTYSRLSYGGESEKMAMGIFKNILANSPNARWILTQINNMNQMKPFTTLMALLDYALACERNIAAQKNSNPSPLNRHLRNQPYGQVPHRSGSTMPALPPPPSRGALPARPQGGFSSPFPRSEIPRPNFSSPQLHNLEADEYEGGGDEVDYDPVAHDGDEIDTAPAVHEDPEDAVALNAMRAFALSTRVNPANTVEQTAQDRRNKACFLCHQAGHFARECPRQSQGSAKPKNK